MAASRVGQSASVPEYELQAPRIIVRKKGCFVCTVEGKVLVIPGLGEMAAKYGAKTGRKYVVLCLDRGEGTYVRVAKKVFLRVLGKKALDKDPHVEIEERLTDRWGMNAPLFQKAMLPADYFDEGPRWRAAFGERFDEIFPMLVDEEAMRAYLKYMWRQKLGPAHVELLKVLIPYAMHKEVVPGEEIVAGVSRWVTEDREIYRVEDPTSPVTVFSKAGEGEEGRGARKFTPIVYCRGNEITRDGHHALETTSQAADSLRAQLPEWNALHAAGIPVFSPPREVYAADGRAMFIVERKKMTLERHLVKTGSLSSQEYVDHTLALFRAVQTLHEKGYVHGKLDVNAFALHRDGSLRFPGVPKLIGHGAPFAYNQAKHANYPEQYRMGKADRVDFDVDLHALAQMIMSTNRVYAAKALDLFRHISLQMVAIEAIRAARPISDLVNLLERLSLVDRTPYTLASLQGMTQGDIIGTPIDGFIPG